MHEKQIATLEVGAHNAAPEMELTQGFGAVAGAALEVAPNSAIEPFQDTSFRGHLQLLQIRDHLPSTNNCSLQLSQSRSR